VSHRAQGFDHSLTQRQPNEAGNLIQSFEQFRDGLPLPPYWVVALYFLALKDSCWPVIPLAGQNTISIQVMAKGEQLAGTGHF